MENTQPITIPAGTYFVGDPCYAFSHASWMKVLSANDCFFESAIEFNGKHVVGFDTMYGDGTYSGFPVDAGLIGCVHVDLIEETSAFRASPACGRLVEFPEPFTVQAYSNGDIRIGNITVKTGHEEEDEGGYAEDE